MIGRAKKRNEGIKIKFKTCPQHGLVKNLRNTATVKIAFMVSRGAGDIIKDILKQKMKYLGAAMTLWLAKNTWLNIYFYRCILGSIIL